MCELDASPSMMARNEDAHGPDSASACALPLVDRRESSTQAASSSPRQPGRMSPGRSSEVSINTHRLCSSLRLSLYLYWLESRPEISLPRLEAGRR
jgi:hypothetical protein